MLSPPYSVVTTKSNPYGDCKMIFSTIGFWSSLSQCCMLISQIKSISIINIHCPWTIEKDNPLKSFDTQFLRVGKGLKDCLFLNNWWTVGIWETYRLCEWDEQADLPQNNLGSRSLSESFSSDHKSCSNIFTKPYEQWI